MSFEPKESPTSYRQDLQPVGEKPQPASKKGLAGSIGAGILVLLGKFKFLFVFLKLGFLLKYLVSAISILGTVFIYALSAPLPFAIGFVTLIFIHEMGHLLVLKRYGLKASAPIFIPYFGAAIAMKDMPLNAEQEAYVAFGGPVLGGLGAFVTLLIWYATGDALYLHLAYLAFILNLFNLVPLRPLDGGRIMNGVSKWFLLLGMLMVLAYILMGHVNFVLVLILLAGGKEIIARFFGGGHEPAAYYEMDFHTKTLITAGYFALVSALAFLAYHAYGLLQSI